MEKIEIKKYDGDICQIIEVDESKLPMIIKNEIKSLKDLEGAVNTAHVKAKGLEEKAKKLQAPTFGKKKLAIEESQDMIRALSEAQEAAATAQDLSFQFQRKLADASRFLFGLGVSNMASNRTVVRQLKEALEGKEADQIDDLVAQEINNVIDQLLVQEDIMNKQEKLADRQDELEDIQEEFSESIENLDSNISSVALEVVNNSEKFENEINRVNLKDEEQDRILSESKKRDEEHDRMLSESLKRDEEQDLLLSESKQRDEYHDKQLLEREKKDKEHDQALLELKNKSDELEKANVEASQRIKDLEKANSHSIEMINQIKSLIEENNKINDKKLVNLENTIGAASKNNEKNISDINDSMTGLKDLFYSKKMGVITIVISILAFILSIIQFFI